LLARLAGLAIEHPMRSSFTLVVGAAAYVLCGAVATAAVACPLPGNFAVTMTGRLPSGIHFTRLAQYEFHGSCDGATGSGTVDERLWSWTGADAGKVYGSAKLRIGDAVDPDYSGNADRKKKMQGHRLFQKSVSRLGRRAGTWTFDGKTIAITWADGPTEQWAHTWQDQAAAPSLHKIELTAASELGGATYLRADGTRDAAAENAGFGFGGPGPDFTVAREIPDVIGGYLGLIKRHNAWCGAADVNEPVAATGLFLDVFHATSTGVLRYVYPDASTWVFVYFGRPKRNRGVLARRVMLQTSHDWGGDGEIADDIGHTYSGLEVVDATGKVRGFVFADASTAFDTCDENHTTSIYYLDTYDCDALYGVDPDNPGEC
jgi:hypothetical protein